MSPHNERCVPTLPQSSLMFIKLQFLLSTHHEPCLFPIFNYVWKNMNTCPCMGTSFTCVGDYCHYLPHPCRNIICCMNVQLVILLVVSLVIMFIMYYENQCVPVAFAAGIGIDVKDNAIILLHQLLIFCTLFVEFLF